MVAQFFCVVMTVTGSMSNIPVEIEPIPYNVEASFAMYPVERNIIARTNAQRERFGLAPLEMDPELMRSARRHATWMTTRRSLQHTSAAVAENIAMGQRDSQQALSSWMNSSGHRANILNRSHRRIGVAAFTTPEGTIYWCQQFRH